MAYDNVVINFGAPRSGTTIMRRLLGPLKDTYVSKLHEATQLHPSKSDDGLLDISQWMQKDTVVFVRTVRHPLSIADSFVALRRKGLRESNQSLVAYADEDIVDVVTAESEGVASQRDGIADNRDEKGWDHHLVEVRYERLDDAGYRDEFARSVCRHLSTAESSYRSLTNRCDAEWKERPVRDGKLRAGIERAMTEEQESWFRERLADVIEREGYDDAWT